MPPGVGGIGGPSPPRRGAGRFDQGRPRQGRPYRPTALSTWMPKRSPAAIQNRMVELAVHDREVPGAICPSCGHPTNLHRRMRNASFCDGCHKGCVAVSSRTY